MKTKLRYGLVGCGGFGQFCLEAYSKMPNVKCVAVADVSNELAAQTAAKNQLEACESPEALIQRDDIDLIHFATPPFTHARLAISALQAGKHVLCEKPLALNLEDARKMIKLASDKHLILAVNLIMRYNPLCKAVKALVDSQILGVPLFASLVNAASDEKLAPEHWFWDREKSGGIFIEHGVHFFDLFEWWFGKGRLLSAQQVIRPGTAFVDQVNCTVQYGETTLGNFYHGFHQMKRRDEQNWRIVFELGTLTMQEWVPTSLALDAAVTQTNLQKIAEILPNSQVKILQRYEGDQRHATSRHTNREMDIQASVSSDAGKIKMDLYGSMLRDLLNDQILAIQNPGHVRIVSEANGFTSLEYAVQAQEAADALSRASHS